MLVPGPRHTTWGSAAQTYPELVFISCPCQELQTCTARAHYKRTIPLLTPSRVLWKNPTAPRIGHSSNTLTEYLKMKQRDCTLWCFAPGTDMRRCGAVSPGTPGIRQERTPAVEFCRCCGFEKYRDSLSRAMILFTANASRLSSAATKVPAPLPRKAH